MTDTDYYTQRLVSQVGSPIPPNQLNPSKFFSHFSCKVLSIAIVLAILPLFPSQAPEFVNQTIFTGSWELLHLLFVGITVSYGLFSRRNIETEKENQVKIDTTQTYVSKILQLSSVFDDEAETPFGSDENKVETWNSKYFRGEPNVVVEEEHPVLDEQASVISTVRNSNPLLLPVRSLKSAVSDSNAVESVRRTSSSLSRTTSGTKTGGSISNSEKSRDREFGDLDPLDLEKKLNETAVLPSPIPWRSRSGRMEYREETGVATPPLYSLPPAVQDSEFDQVKLRSFPSPMGRSSLPNSTSPSPKKLSPSPSLSPELRTKDSEDLGKKKNAYKSSPPPPPPLPTLTTRIGPQKYCNKYYSTFPDDFSSEKKDSTNGFQDELNDMSRTGKEELPRRRDSRMDSLKSEVKPRTRVESSLMGKSVRTIRGTEAIADSKKSLQVGDQVNGKIGKISTEADSLTVEKPSRKNGGFDQYSVTSAEQNVESMPPIQKPTLSMYQKKGKKKLGEKVILEFEEYSSSEADDDVQGGLDTGVADSNIIEDVGPDIHEVDKKADEFIAKFREQIRLQRIDSIKRSTGQPTGRNSSR